MAVMNGCPLGAGSTKLQEARDSRAIGAANYAATDETIRRLDSRRCSPCVGNTRELCCLCNNSSEPIEMPFWADACACAQGTMQAY